MQNPKEKRERPFFARFLEGQAYPKVKTGVAAGTSKPEYEGPQTLKYPSDEEEINGDVGP
jgi:serine endopeptidase inhibitor I10-like protein